MLTLPRYLATLRSRVQLFPALVLVLTLLSISSVVGIAQTSSQTLQPKYTGLPGRTVWALTTTGTSTVTTFAATDKGLWVSANNGQAWTETSLRNQAVYAIKARRVGNSSTLLAGTDRGVLRSVDNGSTWQSVEVTTGSVGATSNVLSLKKVFDIEIIGNFWFAATEKGVFRSNNDGRSWSLVNIDRTADNNEVRGITTDGNTIIVNLWKEGLWRSTNNGNTWSKLTIAGETSLVKSVFMHTSRTLVQQGNRSTTANVSLVFVGAVSGNLWRSTDNGNSWTRTLAAGTALRSLSSAPTGVDIISAIGNRLISGTPNGLAVSNDNGTTWQSLRTTLPQPISLASDNQNVYVGLQQTSSTTVAEKGTSSLSDASPGVGTFTTPTSGQSSCEISSVNSFTPPFLLTGSSAMTVTINGTNFQSGTRFQIVVINDITGNQIYQQTLTSGQSIGGIGVTYNNPNSATLSLSSTILATASRIGVTPYTPNGCPTQAGPGYTFYIPLRIPTITSISPATFLRGSNTTPATVNGDNFEVGSKVFLYHPNLPGGKFELTTTFVNANTLQTAWSYGISFYIGAASSVEVGVENPAGGVTPVRQTLSIVNPTPGAGGLNPIQINAGATSPLSISGTGYFEGSQVFFNGQLKPSTFSNGSLTIQLLPSDIPVAGTYSVVVTNPAPGGGSTQPMTLNVLNPQPYIYSFSPTILGQGQDVTVTLSGGGTFMSGTTVRFYPNDVPLSSTFVNTNIITVTIPGALLPTASETAYTLRAFNPAPGGGASNTVTLTVRNAAPTLTGISPNTLIAASQDVALTLTGSNFLAGAQVLLSGSVPLAATVVNGSTITATLPAQYANAVGTYSIIVRNPNAVGDSQAQMLSVVYPQPQLATLTPSAVQTGSGAMTLTLTGSNFISGAEVLWNGSPVSPSNQTASSMTLGLSAAQLANSAVHTVQVRNPQPNLGESATLFFAVRNPAPTLTAISPTLLLTNLAAPPTITLTGTGFVAESRVIIRSLTTNQDVLTLQPTLTSGTQASFPFPLALISTTAQYAVRVENPALPNNVPPGSPFGGQGGGTTAALTVSTQNPLPTLTGLTPSSLLAGANATTFTLTGTNFLPALRVLVGGQPVPATQATILSETTLELRLPSAALASAATLSVQVSLPAPGGGTSATRTISLTNPLPVLDAVQPSTIPAFQEAVIQALGSGFTPQSQFRLVRGTTTVTLAIVSLPSSTEAFLRISSTAIVTLATYQVRVFNSAPGGGTSVSRNLVVQSGAPVLTEFVGVSTTAVVAGGTLPAFTVRLRDALGNLTDVTTASLTLPIQFSNRTSLLGVSSGTLVLTRSSLGVYTTTATRFSLADSYHFFANNFSSISGLSTTGTRTFTVIPAADSRVTISGVPASTDAGDVLPTFSLRFEDAFGNLTDNGIGRLTYTRVGGSSTATLAMTRVSTGIYTAQSTVCTIAGTYNLAVVGITAANTLGTKSFVIVSGAAVSASVSGLTYSLNAGSLQSAFDVRFSDVYGNFTDRNVPTSVQFTNSTNAVNGVSTGTVALVARIGIGLYDAARVTLTTAGNYAITHASMTMLGNRLFVVRPLAVTKIVVDVPNNMAITLGDVNAAITVIYKDRFNNGSEPVSFPATLQYTGLNVASTGTLELVRTTTATGVLAGTAKARPSALTMIGDYRIDLPAAGFPIAGIQTIRVIGREPERAEISGLPESLCGASGDIEISIRFTDALDLPTDYYPTLIRYVVRRGGVEVQMGDLEFLGELSPGVVRYRLRAPFVPGVYALQIPFPSIPAENVSGTLTMEVCPNLVPSIVLSPTSLFFTAISLSGSVVQTYTIQYQNTNSVTITLPPGFFVRVQNFGAYQSGTVTLPTPGGSGTLTLQLLYEPTALGVVNVNIPHQGVGSSLTTPSRNLNVVVSVVACPVVRDTVTILPVFSQTAQQNLIDDGRNISRYLTDTYRISNPVFRNSGINNVMIRFTNPQGVIVGDNNLFMSNTQVVNARAQARADVVGFYNHNGQYFAPYLGSGRDFDFSYFYVDSRGNPLTYITMHEVGHVLYGAHEFGASTGFDQNDRYADGRGIVQWVHRISPTGVWGSFNHGTMLFHGQGVSTTPPVSERVPFFSNPNISIEVRADADITGTIVQMNGRRTIVMGNAADANMARVIAIEGPIVANQFPTLLSVAILGPDILPRGVSGQYTAQVCSNRDLRYEWSVRPVRTTPEPSFQLVGTDPSLNLSMQQDWDGVIIRVRVFDVVSGTEVGSDILFVRCGSCNDIPVALNNEPKNGASLSAFAAAAGQSSGAEQENISLQGLILEPNYPNPFSQETEIAFVLPTISSVRLTVYDALGREVAALLNGEKYSTGRHTVKFNGTKLPSGVYSLHLQAGIWKTSRTITLIR